MSGLMQTDARQPRSVPSFRARVEMVASQNGVLAFGREIVNAKDVQVVRFDSAVHVLATLLRPCRGAAFRRAAFA